MKRLQELRDRKKRLVAGWFQTMTAEAKKRHRGRLMSISEEIRELRRK